MFVAVLEAAWFFFLVALSVWLCVSVVGVLLAVLMQRFRTAQDALLPYVIVSQTVPLVAIAPVLTGWGGHILVLGHPWQSWMSVAVISGYLAFFPVAVGMLRGLNSPQAAQLGLMHSYAASWWQTLIRLRLPASVGYLVPALRLGAAASVIGTVVAEISTGTRGGIGRLILEYASGVGRHRPDRHRADHRARRIRLSDRSVRLREEHLDAPGRRSGPAHGRKRGGVREDRAGRPARPGLRNRFPVGGSAALAHRAGQHRAAAGAARRE